MAKPSKIEALGLQDKVIALRNNGKSYNDIVITLKEEDNVKISNMAVKRYLDNIKEKIDKKSIEVIKQDKRRITKSINQTYDIINAQLDISNQVLKKLNDIQDVDSMINKITDSAEKLMKLGIEISDREFADQVAFRISDNIKDFTTLTREVRENNKFLADLQSKIYDFSLLEEFTSIFISEFEKYDSSLTQKVLNDIASNPRMKWLAEEQQRLRGE